MTLREALAAARERLGAAGSDEAQIEAEVLLRYVLNLDRAIFLGRLNEAISDTDSGVFQRVLARRAAREPTAYITGRREFHGLDFRVTPAVLIPRPETEMLVDLAVERFATPASGCSIADIGTGSGAIAVSLARALPAARIYATDISPEALAVAKDNALAHGVDNRISFRRGDLPEPLDTKVDVIVANLPYVTEEDWRALPREIREHEPRLALASGAGGLDAIDALLHQAPRYLNFGGSVLLEFGIGQADAIQVIARRHFPSAGIEVRADFAGIPRVLMIET